jgi:hypothetical protein
MRPLEIAEATRIVPASATDIFELLATPARHGEIEGPGTEQGIPRSTPARLALGARFGIGTRFWAPYEVIEFDEDRRITWRHVAGNIWRYTLEPLGVRATKVTAQFDPTRSRFPQIARLFGWDKRDQQSIEHTVHKLVEWASAR